MKIVKLTIILIVIISSSALSQSITLFDVDATDFPIMRAKFYAFDEAGNQQRPGINQLTITENGIERTIINISCPPVEPARAVSSVLTIDVSSSMGRGSLPNLILAQEAARAWVGGLPLGQSECAITTFNHINCLYQDFITNRVKLFSVINSLQAQGGTDYDAALLNPAAGGLQISKNANYKRVIVIITDGIPNRTPDVNSIVAEAKSQNCVIYAVTLNMPCPQSLKEISTQTGGEWFENVTTVEQARIVYLHILQLEQGGGPCAIEWESDAICRAELTNVELNWNSEIGRKIYTPPISAVAILEYEPTILRFDEPEPGVWQSKTVRVTARNAQFIVTNIEASNNSYGISPKSFILEPDESIDLTVSYMAEDLGYTFCQFNFINETCQSFLNARGGLPGIRPSERTIILIHPNGGEVFVAGSDTVITWSGVAEDEPVKLEYRTSDESEWVTIADSATGLSHPFRVPSNESITYLARVSSAIKYIQICEYGEVQIGNQIWMHCNLDVSHYRNGDAILHAQTDAEWIEANMKGIGAWCYYKNDTEYGAIFGKLYNWHAVNDPRGLAPEGWRVSSDADWKELEINFGMTQQQADNWNGRGSPVGAKLAGGYDLWSNGNLHNHNVFDSGSFSGLPGGWRSTDGRFGALRNTATWWTSTEYSSEAAQYRYLTFTSTDVYRVVYNKVLGLSVRCIKE